MNKRRIVAMVLLVLGAASSGSYGQGSGIHTEYMKDSKTTRVETNMLYVYNTSDQFVELMLRSWYKGEKLTSPPTKVDLEVFSFSNNQLYRKDKNRSLVIVADGQESTIGNLTNVVMKGETKNGIDSFFAVGGNPNVGVQVPVPQSAQIKATGNLNGVTMEWMGISLKPDQFLKLAKALKLEFRIGATSLALSDRHMEVVHNFANQITLQ